MFARANSRGCANSFAYGGSRRNSRDAFRLAHISLLVGVAAAAASARDARGGGRTNFPIRAPWRSRPAALFDMRGNGRIRIAVATGEGRRSSARIAESSRTGGTADPWLHANIRRLKVGLAYSSGGPGLERRPGGLTTLCRVQHAVIFPSARRAERLGRELLTPAFARKDVFRLDWPSPE